MKILVVNAGSSTYKCSLYELNGASPHEMPPPIWKGRVEYCPEELSLVPKKIEHLLSSLPHGIDMIGHRVVHGGTRFVHPQWITPSVKQAICELSRLAPLHNPANLQGIELMERLLPATPQAAVFDTAFHCTMPPEAKNYPVPEQWLHLGIQRFGFHGISHHYCSQRASLLLGKRESNIISCHLGNGSSITAIRDGQSICTSMGFTPMEGVMMGTRSGSIDPGILLYLQREHQYSSAQLEEELNYQSGLKGICGNYDLREILAKRSQRDAAAALAYDMLIHSLLKNIGAMLGVLGGLDVLIFTGGIGENADCLRNDVCKRFGFLGLALDEDKNQANGEDRCITADYSSVKVLVIHTREDLAIAQACLQLQII